MPTKERREREAARAKGAAKTSKKAPAKAAPARKLTKDETTPRRTFAQTLPTPVGDDVLKMRSKELTAALARKDEIEKEKKGVVADYKAMSEEVEKRIVQLRRVIDTGKEDQPVECGEFLDYQRKAVLVKRLDTGETIGTSTMEEKDLQLAMSFPSRKDDAPAAEPAPAPAGDQAGDAAVTAPGGDAPSGDPPAGGSDGSGEPVH